MKTGLLSVVFAALAGTAMAADWSPLERAGDISSEITSDIRVLDIRSPKAFAEGHITGAANVPYGLFRGPKDNPGRVPEVEDLEALLEAAGVAVDQQILIVSQGDTATDFGATARVYWTLKSLGLTDLTILNGGVQDWVAAGGALSREITKIEPTDIEVSFDDRWWMDIDGVEAVIDGDSDAVLIDARPHKFFVGGIKHKAAVFAGTIAGAMNLSHETWFIGKNPIVTPTDATLNTVREIAADNPGAPLVSFCNTGHWAATNWFVASELAGIEGVKLYPESMVGWTLFDNPVVTGSNS